MPILDSLVAGCKQSRLLQDRELLHLHTLCDETKLCVLVYHTIHSGSSDDQAYENTL